MKRLSFFTNPDNIAIRVDSKDYELRPGASLTPLEIVKTQDFKVVLDGLNDPSNSNGKKKQMAARYNQALADMLSVLVVDWQPDMIDTFSRLGAIQLGEMVQAVFPPSSEQSQGNLQVQ